MRLLKYILILLFSFFILGAFYIFRGKILSFFGETPIEKRPEISIAQIQKEISTPPPLLAEKEFPAAFLTKAGIIAETNVQRKKAGLPPLSENIKLNLAASLKVQDMFENQYFGHVSPSGQDVTDLAEIVGYEFLAIGENLALGNFGDDKTLVKSWMESPGHRANILSKRYTEIGVAVFQGFFEGEKTWIAVQEFGKPLTACPQPDETLKAQIESLEIQLSNLEKELIKKQRELEKLRPLWGSEDREKVKEYNLLVSQYNALAKKIEDLVQLYNAQVQSFNFCVRG